MRRLGVLGVLLLAAALVTSLAAYRWVDHRIVHVSALSGAAGTPGKTYLIVGSDARDGWAEDGTEGARTDTIMVLHQPESGPTALISIPRDSYVEIPGYGPQKVNAAFAFGGAPLLVTVVEQMTGLTMDGYIEVGFLGVTGMVDAVGGVNLCHDSDVNDPLSGMVWTAGCHDVDGAGALAFSRMRHEDPLGDIGRVQRQQQVVSAVTHKALDAATLRNPGKAMDVADAGLGSVAVSDGTGPWQLWQMAQVFKSAQGPDAIKGTPPIETIDYRVDGVGSTVLLDPEQAGPFWEAIANGDYPPGTQVGGY